MSFHEARVRVRFAETDQMGIVYHANYLIWMEIGRVEYCRAQGVRYKDMEEVDHVLLTVVEAHCRYLSPARYDEEVIIRTSVLEAKTRMVRFGYELREANSGRLLATGETKHFFCGPDMRPCRLPEKYHAALRVT